MTISNMPPFIQKTLLWLWGTTHTRLAWVVLVTMGGFIIATGQEMVDRKIQETMKPQIDSVHSQVEAVNTKVESLRVEVNKGNQNVYALIEVMSDAFPEFKEAASKRAFKNRENEKIKNSLIGEW